MPGDADATGEPETIKAIVTRRYSIVSKRAETTVCGRSGLPNGSSDVTFSARNTCAPMALASELLSRRYPFFLFSSPRLMYVTENPRARSSGFRKSLRSEESIPAANAAVSCHETTVQAGTELFPEEIYAPYFAGNRFMRKFMKRFAIFDATIFRERASEGTVRSDKLDEFRIFYNRKLCLVRRA